VALVTLLAAVLLRSISIALISVAPNLIPILGIEAWLLIWGRPMTITDAIGLTIAFGIAVDNAIHLLNRLRLERASLGHPTRAEISAAITAVVPPIATTTLILAAGLGTTVFSALPSAALFGQLVTGAMILAFLADLFLFPSLLALRDISEEKK
jgi:predicted RND superfamily exporter protein